MSKNICGKMVTKDNPYEVWMRSTKEGNWKWYVLKKYKSEESEKKDEYARWFCFVTSPFCPDGEYGDTYKNEIVKYALRIK